MHRSRRFISLANGVELPTPVGANETGTETFPDAYWHTAQASGPARARRRLARGRGACHGCRNKTRLRGDKGTPTPGGRERRNLRGPGLGNPSYLNSIASAYVGVLRQKFVWDFLTHNAQAASTGPPVRRPLHDGDDPAGDHRDAGPFRPAGRAHHRAAGQPAARQLCAPRTSARSATRREARRPLRLDGLLWAENPQLPEASDHRLADLEQPNIPVYWQPAPEPALRADAAGFASQKIKAVEPNAEIVTAGIQTRTSAARSPS